MAGRIKIRTSQREQLLDIGAQVREALRNSDVREGLLFLWSLHTTCAVTVNEGADPDVARDIVATMRQLVPERGNYRHSEENSDAHVKTSMFGPGCTLIIENGDVLLGTWQHIFLAEWDGPREREIALQIITNH